jgi:hypothetical protein
VVEPLPANLSDVKIDKSKIFDTINDYPACCTAGWTLPDLSFFKGTSPTFSGPLLLLLDLDNYGTLSMYTFFSRGPLRK